MSVDLKSIKFLSFVVFRWYFRKIKRIEAEKKLLLPENEHGAFLIRDSESRHNDYSLSGECLMEFGEFASRIDLVGS
jgi:hypothetical protein